LALLPHGVFNGGSNSAGAGRIAGRWIPQSLRHGRLAAGAARRGRRRDGRNPLAAGEDHL